MIRLGTLLWLALVAVAGFSVFKVSYRVQAQEQELTRLDRQIQRDRDEIQVLHAEWAHLNEPDRLGELAKRHLDLAPVTGIQIVRFDALPQRQAATVDEAARSADPIQSLLTQLDQASGAGQMPNTPDANPLGGTP